MASEPAYRISAQQLIEETGNRPIVTCSLSIDIGLGGGIVLGSTVVIGGAPKAGKSTLALQYAANAQNLYNSKVFFYNIEGRLTKLIFEQIRGIKTDIDHFEVVMPPAITDKTGKVIGNKKWSSEQWLENIGETLVNNKNAVIIVDSISNFSSEKEQSEALGYSDRGRSKGIESQFCRKFADSIIPNQNTLFLLAQGYANTSNYGAAYLMKCSNAFKHQADVILFIKSTEKWDEQGGKILGHNMKILVQSSSLGPSNVDVLQPLRYKYGIDNLQDIVTHSINWEMIVKSTSWYCLPFIETDNKIEYKEITEELRADKEQMKQFVKKQGEDSVRNFIGNNKEVAAKLLSIIKQKVLG